MACILLWSSGLHQYTSVYQYGKLRMFQFHYDFLDTFLSREDYELCEMDADSFVMALSGSTLKEAVKPDLRPQFNQEWSKGLPAQACDAHQADFIACRLAHRHWTPPSCCLQRQNFDKRKPGLLKVEFEGDGIVALYSKTYHCFRNSHDKLSCKGLNKRLNDFNEDWYFKMLGTQSSGRWKQLPS